MTIRYLFHNWLLILLCMIGMITMMGCGSTSSQASLDNPTESLDTAVIGPGVRALLASRFETLDDLKKVVEIQYFNDGVEGCDSSNQRACVILSYKWLKDGIQSTLHSGVTQEDFDVARNGGLSDRLNLILLSPYAVGNRVDLNKVHKLARRRPAYFGEGDVAFYDLAEHSVWNINTPDLAFMGERDSSEKGYLNTFNHITSQAFMTSCFNQEIADFIADVHERHNMKELTTGLFTQEQLVDPDRNPMDNYVDMINNEIGQILGKQLKEKYHINQSTVWTSKLLSDYMNDLQTYYAWSFGIGFKPYQENDLLMKRFAEKLNVVSAGVPYEDI